MEKRIITISREFGSGGRTIGKLVAEHLGIQCYDAELIQKLAAESGFDESYIKEDRANCRPPAFRYADGRQFCQRQFWGGRG